MDAVQHNAGSHDSARCRCAFTLWRDGGLRALASALCVCLLAGCATVRPGGAGQGVSLVPAGKSAAAPRPAFGDRALRAAFARHRAALAAAADDGVRLELVADLAAAVTGWIMANPDADPADLATAEDALSRLERDAVRLRFRVGIRQADTDFATAGDDDARRTALERAQQLVEQALASDAFSPVEQEQNRQTLRRVTRQVAALDLREVVQAARATLQERADFAQAMQACQAALDRLAQERTRPYWGAADLRSIEALHAELAGAIAAARKEYEECLAEVRAELEREQLAMVNATAAADYQRAKELYRGEAAKRLNWKVLSRWRDDLRALGHALVLCDRVLAEKRVDYPLRLATAELRASIEARLDRGDRQIARAAPPLPRYTELPSYPNRTEAEQRAQAATDWTDTVAVGERVHPPAATLPDNATITEEEVQQ